MIPTIGTQPATVLVHHLTELVTAARAARSETSARPGEHASHASAWAAQTPTSDQASTHADQAGSSVLDWPDRNPLTGPTPAFEATILDRQHAEALAPPNPADRQSDERPPNGAGIAIKAAKYNVPPSAGERAAEGIATTRRIGSHAEVIINVSR